MGQGASAGAGGYVHSDYLTITDTGSFSLSLDGTDLSALLELFASGLSGGGGAALTPDGNLSLIDDLGGTSSGKQFITVETKAATCSISSSTGMTRGADRPLPEPGGRGGPPGTDGDGEAQEARRSHLYGESARPGR